MNAPHPVDPKALEGSIDAAMHNALLHAMELHGAEAEDLEAAEVSSLVHVTGAWSGLVLIRANSANARRVTAALLGLSEDAATPEDLFDAFSELANVVAGNVKAVLPAPSDLTLPVACAGALHAPGAQMVAARSFAAAETPGLRVDVLAGVSSAPETESES